MKQGTDSGSVYSDIKVILPIILTIVALLASGAAFIACLKKRKSIVLVGITQITHFQILSYELLKILGQNREPKENLDNQQNAEAQRERYYATIHKVSLQAGQEKIPGEFSIIIVEDFVDVFSFASERNV